MLPARQRADATNGCVNRADTGAVPLSPDHALMIGRRDFAAFQQQATIVFKNQLRIVQGAAVALIHAHHQHHSVLGRRLRQQLGDRTRHLHGPFVKPQVILPHLNCGSDKREIGIIRNERLGKNG